MLRSRLPVRASQYALNKWLRPTEYPQSAIFTPLHSIGRGVVLGRYISTPIHIHHCDSMVAIFDTITRGLMLTPKSTLREFCKRILIKVSLLDFVLRWVDVGGVQFANRFLYASVLLD